MNIPRNETERINKTHVEFLKVKTCSISQLPSVDGANERSDTAENTGKLEDDTQNEAQRETWPKVTSKIRAHLEVNGSENTTFQTCEM